MTKRHLIPVLASAYIVTILSLVLLLFEQSWLDVVLSEPLYGYSIILFFLSSVFVLIIIHKSGFLSPSIFLLIIFLLCPWVGSENFREFVARFGDFYGTPMPSFAFPTFVWSIGTVSFFAGVLLAFLFIPGLNRNLMALWDRKRMQLLFYLTLALSLIATIIAIGRIGYIPLLVGDITGERVDYVEIVGAFIYRFSGLWLIAGLMASILFFFEKRKSRYLYLLIVIASGLGKMVYGQRTGLIVIGVIFVLMYLKFVRPKMSHVLLIGVTASVLVFLLMRQGEFKEGHYSSDQSLKKTIVRNSFHEWRYYSTVVDETKATEEYLGWQIFLGPLISLVPRQVCALFGYDKNEVIRQYSAVFYYGRMFDDPYGIRLTPIGEAFAGYGVRGVILLLFILGIFFGAFEKFYFSLKRQDARLFVICYLFSMMIYLPIATILNLFAPLIQTGLVVFVYYYFGTRKLRLEDSKSSEITVPVFSPQRIAS
jgi:oligosaccharide repeat unit polymerase